MTQDKEIDEGFLLCKKCSLTFPIISKVPIIWNDFTKYLSSRKKLGGFLYTQSSKNEMKSFIKQSLSKTKYQNEDQTELEKRWVNIYSLNKHARFYSKIKKILDNIPSSKLCLEHGCSIGIISEHLAKRNTLVFGIDRSYHAIMHAKKNMIKNLDYFVSDTTSHPFDSQKFNIVLALNMLEIVEPKELLQIISNQIKTGFVLITDPYDYERGQNSVKVKLYENSLRAEIHKSGFKIIPKFKKPSHIQWVLKLNPRAQLNYMVDVVMAKK